MNGNAFFDKSVIDFKIIFPVPYHIYKPDIEYLPSDSKAGRLIAVAATV